MADVKTEPCSEHCTRSIHCSCLIDLSSPATIERDFYAWLNGMAPSVSNTYYPSSEAPRLTTEVPEDNDVLPENVIDSAKREDVRKPRRKGTNLYGRPYCPGRPLSMVERRRIIDLHMSGMKVNAISKALCISHGCVSKIISRYRQTGILSPASSPEQRRTRRKKNESPQSASSLVDLHEYKP
ncbi:hypothetical protein Angca_002273, partial [Angiostrongylus cantonensis]